MSMEVYSPHYRDWTSAELPLLATAPPEILDRLCHEMMGLDGPVPEGEAMAAIYPMFADGRLPRTKVVCGVVYRSDAVEQALATYRRPIEPLCRPDVPLDRLMRLVEGVREWTGEEALRLELSEDDDGSICARVYRRRSMRDDPPAELVEFLNNASVLHDAHAVILAVLAAGIVYGRKEGA